MLAFAAAGLNIGLVFGLEEGHPVGLFTLCVTAAWAAARQKRWKTAAVLVGALVGLKPFFSCLLLMWVCRRQWNAIGWALATAAASLLAGIALGGTVGFLRWLDTGRHVSWFHHPLNASIAGLAARAGVSWQLWALMTLFVVFVTFLVLRKTKDLDAEWLACGLVSLLASPLGWAYYVPLVAGPLGAVAIRRRIMLPAAAGFVWPIPLAMALVPTTTAWTRITIISLTSWSLIAMWSIVVNMLSRGERPWPLRFSTPRPSLPDATPAHR
jgi:hypothetical protein